MFSLLIPVQNNENKFKIPIRHRRYGPVFYRSVPACFCLPNNFDTLTAGWYLYFTGTYLDAAICALWVILAFVTLASSDPFRLFSESNLKILLLSLYLTLQFNQIQLALRICN